MADGSLRTVTAGDVFPLADAPATQVPTTERVD
jgi:hypothetical protein